MNRIRSSLLLLLFVSAACGDDDDGNQPDGGGNTAQLRVVHAAPGAPAVDVYAEGNPTPLVANLPYGEVSSYVTVPAGSYAIQVRAAGSPSTSTPAHQTPSLNVAAGARITAVAAGLLASSDDADRFRVLALAEGFGTPAASNARVRIVHASADAPSVGIDVGDDGNADIESLDRFDDTGASGIDLPAGAALQIGILAGSTRVTAFTTPELPAGADLFVIATGLLGRPPRDAEGFGLLAVGPTGKVGLLRQNPVVYALHGSPDAPAVDVFAGPAELVDDLTFGRLSAPIQVPPGTYTIECVRPRRGEHASRRRPRPVGVQRRARRRRALPRRRDRLPHRHGRRAGLPAPARFREGFDGDTSTGALVRAVHSSPDAPAVDVGLATGDVLTPVPGLTGLSFPDASAEAGIPSRRPL